MNTLRYFKDVAESSEDGFRGDRFEGLAAWWQPDKVSLTIAGRKIDSKSLAAPIALYMDDILNRNVFCMYSIDFKANQAIREDQIQEFQDSLKIHQRGFGLGKYVLVTYETEVFVNRVRTALNKAHKTVVYGLVTYFDHKTFSGKFEEKEWGFIKRNIFAAQKEYRIIVDAGSKDKEPFKLQIGDIGDITEIMTTERFNRTLKVSIPSS